MPLASGWLFISKSCLHVPDRLCRDDGSSCTVRLLEQSLSRDLPRFSCGNPGQSCSCISTMNYQLGDVYTNYISEGLSSIYVVPL